MLNDLLTRRFEELDTQYAALPRRPSQMGGRSTYVPSGDWRQWATSAENLILTVCGEPSPHYKNFTANQAACNGNDSEIHALYGVFRSAKEDYLGGYIFDVDLRVSGEVFGDFIALAKTSLAEGFKDVAAVLACAALEDALKRYGLANNLDVNDKAMPEVINALKSGGLVSGAQKTILDAMPKVRNHALHAEWGKLSEPDVNSVIGFVEQFLLVKFSP